MLSFWNLGRLSIIVGNPYKGSFQNFFFGKSWDFVLRRGGGGLTQSQLFQTKITTIQKGNFVAIWRGFPSPNQKIVKNDIKNHPKSHKNHREAPLSDLFNYWICREPQRGAADSAEEKWNNQVAKRAGVNNGVDASYVQLAVQPEVPCDLRVSTTKKWTIRE